jgi:beta-glucanase (GH16 family)
MTLVCNLVRTGSLEIKLAGAVANLILIAGLISTKPVLAANILGNPGFESGSLSGWSTFGPNNSIQTSASVAHSGTYYYKVYGQFNAAYNDTGIYQDNPSAPGAIYSADGWAYSLSSDAIHGQDLIWLEVSFRDASYKALALYRSVVVGTNNLASFGGTSKWFDLQITNRCSYTNASALILSPGIATNTVTNLVAPAGTAYVRYQIVFEQGPDNANGSMYFDDVTLNQTGGTVVVPPVTQWNIVWSDEFNGNSISATNWTFETGGGGWGNQELEYYTTSPQNAYVSNGLLHIVALQSMGGTSYTSARMKTQGLYTTPTYGRFEWRAALPAGTGMWPALWMLGADYPSVGWPACGEIDVVENNGATPTWVQGSLHSNGGDPTAKYKFPSGGSTTNFHTYLLDWEPNSITFSVDGHLYETQSSQAPFNAPFFLIMNLAVGGQYVGNPTTNAINAGTVFPAEMQVDYVRVYELTAPLAFSVTTQPNGSLILTWPTNIVCHMQVQTNFLTGTNWFDTSVTTSPFVVSPDPNNTSVFYRLQ